MDETQRAYAAHRVAIRAGLKAYQEELVRMLKLYGADLNKLYGSSHQHNGAFVLDEPADMVVPLITVVHFGRECERSTFDKLCATNGWDKRLVVDGEEQQLD